MGAAPEDGGALTLRFKYWSATAATDADRFMHGALERWSTPGQASESAALSHEEGR